MPGTSEPEDPVVEEDNGQPLLTSNGRQPSVLGLSIVSVLNVICLAFIGYHFASHPHETAYEGQEATSNKSSVANVTPILEKPSAIPINVESRDGAGNIDFAPTSRFILSIASGIDPADEAANMVRGGSNSMTPETTVSFETAAVQHSSKSQEGRFWVQLGALSQEETARHYWSDLKKRHPTLLNGREPRYFGPSEVGGSLYHIRLGPMLDDAAESLCDELEAEGADCFCIRPPKA